MGHIARRQDFSTARPLGSAGAIGLNDLRSLSDLARFLQDYLDCELALVSLRDADGVWAVRGGNDMPIPSSMNNPDGLADPVAARACGMQFFAGLPLRDESGRCIGTMAAMDGAARPLSGEELGVMRQLAGVAAALCMADGED